MLKLGIALVLFLSFSINLLADFPSIESGQYIRLDASEFGKPFLLKASMIPQNLSATSRGLCSKVVTFKQKGDKIFLMEVTSGHVVTNSLPAQLILAEFPRVDWGEAIHLDFNAGMKKLFMARNWYASDFEGRNYSMLDQSSGVEITNSFIEKMESKNEKIDIRQLVQLRLEDGSAHPTYEVRYTLERYNPSKTFTAKESTSFRRVGLFEARPKIEKNSGRVSIKATRWDISKPITYYVSANTPPEFTDAVKEGILYWNKAFGREVLKAEVAPIGVTAPDLNHNIVQWVEWEAAGSAYADALYDPLTGEIQNAQIYLTSVFALGSRQKGRALLRSLRLNLEQSQSVVASVEKTVFPELIKPNQLCSHDMKAEFTHALEEMLNSDADDKTIEAFAKHYIRTVVAHEVGHTLGYRHNFVGKLGANTDHVERDKIIKTLQETGSIPNQDQVIITTSVMDYLDYKDDVISGRQMLDSKKAFAYDELVTKFNYSDSEKKESDIYPDVAPIFCTDSDLGKYADCQLFASGAKPLEYHHWEIANTILQLPASIVETYIAAKSPVDERDRLPLTEVMLRPERFAKQIAAHYQKLLLWMQDETRSAYIEKHLPFVGKVNEDEVSLKKLEWIERQIEALGGVEHTFFGLLPIKVEWDKIAQPKGSYAIPSNFIEKSKKSLQEYLKKDNVKNYIGLDGKNYSFTEDEIAVIIKSSEKFYTKFEESLLEELIDTLLKARINVEYRTKKQLKEDGISIKIEKRIFELVEHIIFAEKPEHIMGHVEFVANEIKPKIAVSAYKYPFELRKKAAMLLGSNIGEGHDWSIEGRRSIATKLRKQIESSLGKSLEELNPNMVHRPLRQWYLEQKEVLMRAMTKLTGAVEPGCEEILKPKKVQNQP